MEEVFSGYHMVASLQEPQLAPQRICMHQAAVQSRIPDFVSSREHTMVVHDRWTKASRVAKVPAPGQCGKDKVLQSGTDEAQGLPSKGSAEFYRAGPGVVASSLVDVAMISCCPFTPR
jgi:hypothetical protein